MEARRKRFLQDLFALFGHNPVRSFSMRNKMFEALPLPDQIALVRAQIRQLEAQEGVLRTQLEAACGASARLCGLSPSPAETEVDPAALPEDALARLSAMPIGSYLA
jgi:hypothetical protein